MISHISGALAMVGGFAVVAVVAALVYESAKHGWGWVKTKSQAKAAAAEAKAKAPLAPIQADLAAIKQKLGIPG